MVFIAISPIPIHSLLSNWVRLAAINIINIFLISLICLWKRQRYVLSWISVVSALLLLCLSPPVLHSSISILILFLCYTLLPLQLQPSALTAISVTFVALLLQFLNGADIKQVFFNTYLRAAQDSR